MMQSRMTPRKEGPVLVGSPFRRSDVEYTTVYWINPMTGEERSWSIPIEFIATFFEPESSGDYWEFEYGRSQWLQKKEV